MNSKPIQLREAGYAAYSTRVDINKSTQRDQLTSISNCQKGNFYRHYGNVSLSWLNRVNWDNLVYHGHNTLAIGKDIIPRHSVYLTDYNPIWISYADMDLSPDRLIDNLIHLYTSLPSEESKTTIPVHIFTDQGFVRMNFEADYEKRVSLSTLAMTMKLLHHLAQFFPLMVLNLHDHAMMKAKNPVGYTCSCGFRNRKVPNALFK
jgi:hypothetical protein